MATTIGLPSLSIVFEKAAQATANRSKKGFVGVFVRDSKAQGVHQLSSAALIPSELGADNQAYIERAFTGSDRGQPSKVVAVVIAQDEDGAAFEAGLKLIEGLSLDYVAGPPDITAGEKTALIEWAEGRRENYYTEKVIIPNAATPPDSMGVIDFAETDDDQRIRASGLYEDWQAGSYQVGDIRNAGGQTWECFQAHDNATYPDIVPDNPAWFTFWRPLHGKSPETARPFVPVQGAHDMYRAGEYIIFTDGIVYRCTQDTAYSPEEYADAWETWEDENQENPGQ